MENIMRQLDNKFTSNSSMQKLNTVGAGSTNVLSP